MGDAAMRGTGVAVRTPSLAFRVPDRELARLDVSRDGPVSLRLVATATDGSSAERELAPLDVAGGTVRAVDRLSAQVVTIPLARISSVKPAGARP